MIDISDLIRSAEDAQGAIENLTDMSISEIEYAAQEAYTEISNVIEELRSCEDTFDELSNVMTALKLHRIDELTDAVTDLEQDLKEHKEIVDTLRDQNDTLREANSALQETNAMLRKQVEAAGQRDGSSSLDSRSSLVRW